jgi:glutathione synthase/RimK-type ligase-like ATP-grasp enzyme
MRVGLVTCPELPELDPDDRGLADSLRRRGVEVVPAVWSDRSVRWSGLDVAVVRSTWDYHRHHAEFLAWVDRAGAVVRLLNAPETLRWNSDKRYLRDLAARGIAIPPTVWGSEIGSVTETLRERGWRRAVLKPAVSASAERTFLLRAEEADRNEATLRTLRSAGEVLLQPYLPAVEAPGERSLVFLGGAYSHAVLRAAKLSPQAAVRDGEPTTPRPEELALARRAVASVDPPPLYARVDVVNDLDGRPCVAELELIEPLLYLATAPGAADRLAEALLRRAGEPISAAGSAGRG